jgi:hypothetical protein
LCHGDFVGQNGDLADGAILGPIVVERVNDMKQAKNALGTDSALLRY